MSAVIDWEQLDMIADGFTPDFVEIYDEFVVEIPGLLAQLRENVAARDPQLSSRTAHQLKGSAANFGFVGVSGPMAALEMEAKAGSLERADEHIAAAEAGFAAAAGEVKARRGV